jgi:capsular exopolysaccharide synthesis family protein
MGAHSDKRELPALNFGSQHFEPAATNGESPSGRDRFVDLALITQLLCRYKWLAIGTIIAALGIASGAYWLAPKVYIAEAVLALDRHDQQIVRTAQSARDEIVDSPAVDTEVQVLLSPEVARAAVQRLQLNADPAFLLAQAPAAGRPLSIEAAAHLVRSGLTVERQGLSFAIDLAFRSSDANTSAKVANAVADAYVSGQVQAAQNSRGLDIGMLRARLEQLRGEVQKAEAAVAQYRARADLLSISDNDTIAQQELSTLNTELASAKADMAASVGRAGANSGENGSMVNASPVISDLRRQVAGLERKLAEQAISLGPNHPDRVRTEANLAAGRIALDREVSRASSGVSQDVRVASQRVSALQGAIGSARSRLVSGNNASVRLAELDRVAESARQLYQTFLDRYRVELATRGTEKSKAEIISRAQVPRHPASPDFAVYGVCGLAGGCIAALLLCFILEWRERGIRTRAEAEAFTGFDVISSLPDIGTMDEPEFHKGQRLSVPDFLVEFRDTPFAESVRAIWTNLRVGQTGQLVRTVGLTSSLPEEGKTSTAIALARSIALAGRRILLIDCDFRRRGTTLALQLLDRPGLVEVLEGKAKLEEIVAIDRPSGAFVLPLNSAHETGGDIVQSDAMMALLEHCKTRYDLVVLDIAPAIPVAEARALAAMVDAVLVVVRWRTTPRTVLKTALRELNRAGARISGVLLTQVDTRSRAVLEGESPYYQYYYARSVTA